MQPINTTRKKIAAFKVLMLAIVVISAGKSYGQSRNELSFHLKGPFSSLSYEHEQDEQNMGNGLGAGVNYSRYLNENWSLSTGAEVQSFQGSANYNSINDAYQATDIEGEEFEFRYSLQNFSEEQAAYYLNIPLKIQYETTGQIRFFAAGGAKVGFNLKSEYESEASSIVTSGYYQQYDAELSAPEFMGFGEFEGIDNSKKSLDLKTSYMINLETGVKFLLQDDRAFYMGLFVDYGFNDLMEKNSLQNLISYNTEDPTSFPSNSVLNSTNKTEGKEYIDKVQNMAMGLKIRYALGL
ncbi:outer membrane beta-barrel protein [Salinimicrobium sp. GXAS 041]|uniref:outer membrane beta-barrel protein n=1 Tax=Salinimicrobium sp. GXAS 041 TaxID=3400806 RepID=UPI003C773A36